MVKGRSRMARDSNCTSSASSDRTVNVPSSCSSTLVGTCISRRSKSPGRGGNWSALPCSSRANGCRATLRRRRTKSATRCMSLAFATCHPWRLGGSGWQHGTPRWRHLGGSAVELKIAPRPTARGASKRCGLGSHATTSCPRVGYVASKTAPLHEGDLAICCCYRFAGKRGRCISSMHFVGL
jgi:hypothetical protein